MLDICETLEAGVHMIVYADDIVLYVIDPNEDCARLKIQNTLPRISAWSRANELFEPNKCHAINFSRRRRAGEPLKLQGVELPWETHVKFLGIWLTRTLRFTHHFNIVKLKIFERIKYLKASTSRSRGITSFHMLRIVNSLICSNLEYGAPHFYDSLPSAVNTLEVSYNAAIRLAMGLRMWTPIPVLRHEAVVSSISNLLSLLTKLFPLRLLSFPPGLRLEDIAR